MCKILKELLALPGIKIIYGPSAVGKTALSLQIIRDNCLTVAQGECLYITTEGFNFMKRAEKIGIDFSSLIVAEAHDLLDILVLVEEGINKFIQARLVVIDSITAPYRRQALEKHSFKLFNYILGVLHIISRTFGTIFICTSQVHEIDSQIEAVGMKALDLWSNYILRLERENDKRIAIREKPKPLDTAEFLIEEKGITWLKC